MRYRLKLLGKLCTALIVLALFVAAWLINWCGLLYLTLCTSRERFEKQRHPLAIVDLLYTPHRALEQHTRGAEAMRMN